MRGKKTPSYPVRERYFFECYGCEDVTEENLHILFDLIVERSGMKLLLPPQGVQADDGYSIQGIWEASTLAIHGWDDINFVTVDVYSCKEIDPWKVMKVILSVLQPKKVYFGSFNHNDFVPIYRAHV